MLCSVIPRLYFLHVPFVLPSFQGKNILILLKCHSTMVNALASWDLWLQSCYLQRQDDYPSSPTGSNSTLLDKKMICQELQQEDDSFWIWNTRSYLQLLCLSPPVFPMLCKQDDTQVPVSSVSTCRLTGRNCLYLLLFSLSYSCEYAVTALYVNAIKIYFIFCVQGFNLLYWSGYT